MAYEHKPNTGSLFKNDRKEKPNHPDYKGASKHQCPSCNHAFEQDLGAWLKDLPRGGKVMSISFSPKRERQQQQEPPPDRDVSNVPSGPDTDPLPF